MEEVTVNKKGLSIIGAFWLAILISIVEIILYIPFEIIKIIIIDISSIEGIGSYIYVIGEIVINIVVVYWLVNRMRKKEGFSLKFKYRTNIKEYIYGLFFLGAHLYIFSNTFGILIQRIEVSQRVVEAFDRMFMNPITAFISICIIAPIFEEIVYRGIILEQLSKRYGMATSIIISALIFGLVHWNFHQGVNTFFVGLILGFIYLKTKSLLLCIFWHFANNFLVFIVSMYVPEAVRDTAPGFNITQLGLGLILFIISYKFFNNIKDDLQLSASDV